MTGIVTMEPLRPVKRAHLFGKPYRWMLAPDGQLTLQAETPIPTRQPLTNPTTRDFIQAARRRLQ
jgi:hypothetical protein